MQEQAVRIGVDLLPAATRHFLADPLEGADVERHAMPQQGPWGRVWIPESGGSNLWGDDWAVGRLQQLTMHRIDVLPNTPRNGRRSWPWPIPSGGRSRWGVCLNSSML